ncbi:MAG TPA: hypothetical protein VHN77_15000 [Phycisphaerales bacterium]|nr:hypothetical protein [Phycisphaerales bacterium]
MAPRNAPHTIPDRRDTRVRRGELARVRGARPVTRAREVLAVRVIAIGSVRAALLRL